MADDRVSEPAQASVSTDAAQSPMLAGKRRQRALRQARFLRAFRQTGDLRGSAEAAKISTWSIWHWRRSDEQFARSFEEAEDLAIMELEARRRALAGSDRLLIFLLSSRRPDRYGYGRAFAARVQIADKIALEMRAVWEGMGDYCPPVAEVDRVGAIVELPDASESA